MVVILRYFAEFGSFWGQLIKMAEDEATLSATKNVAQRSSF